MKQYFKNHPLINYNGQQMRNLLSSAQITKEVLASTTNFLPYKIQEGDTITSVAFNYYGSVDYAWLVLFSNDATDIYSFWPKTEEQIQEYIIKNYGSMDAGYKYIHHYYHKTDPYYPPITQTTFMFALTPAEQNNFFPKFLYDHLVEENEKKRQISLIDKVYAARIALELEKKLAS